MLKQSCDSIGDDDASTSHMKREDSLPHSGVKDVQTDLTIGLASSQKQVFLPHTAIEDRELCNPYSSFQQRPWSCNFLPKQVPESVIPQGFEANTGMSSQMRVARPPVEGRIKNQMLPRYWPRITEEELQQISGDSNSTVIPLFEKVLSASDAGRIGRLVLPKACAEAYFPPISQPEGIPLRIQDVKGKEWLFQFRFWPNNNSRMYVLEGVTPCIQSMQLKAGDTVTFSRMEPGGKLLMGSRKALVSTTVQDPRIAAMHIGVNTIENLTNMGDYSNLLQSLKRNPDSHIHSLSRNIDLSIGDTYEKQGSKSRADSSFQPDKKRSRNIGSKSKRLNIETQVALELKYTWEELQDMLIPSFMQPSIVTIDDYEFEEYEDPPVFGKGSIFTVRSSGEQEQWAQCDNCSKWRRLPADFLPPAKWTCQENVWDQSRSACFAPNELNPRELEHLLGMAIEFNKCRNSVSYSPDQAQEPIEPNQPDPSIATTTKHPRHRPGCSCIVCSQPPSGKNKHKPNCTCNVCMTVKRRFKTLMLRKQQRQSEREAEIAEKNQLKLSPKTETAVKESISTGKGKLDLNIHPHHVQANPSHTTHATMMSLLQAANQPLETYMKQNGLTSLVSEQQASSGYSPSHHEEPQEQDHNGNSL